MFNAVEFVATPTADIPAKYDLTIKSQTPIRSEILVRGDAVKDILYKFIISYEIE